MLHKQIFESAGYAFGTCAKYYCFFAIPAIWWWFPAIFISKLCDLRMAA